MFAGHLFADELDQNAFVAAAVELAVEDLLPGTEVQSAFRDRDHHLTSHDLALEMRVGVVLETVVVVLGVRLLRRQFFQPFLEVGVKARFIVVDENARGDVHGVHEAKTFLNAGSGEFGFDLRCDVDESPSRRDVEEEFFSV